MLFLILPFLISSDFSVLILSKTKNKTVNITYKANNTEKAAVKANTDNSLSSQSQLRQAALNVVNSFRAKSGVKAVKMSSKYNAVLDKRATEKAKQYVTTGTYDHSGYNSLLRYLSTYPIVNGKIIYYGSETLHACYYNAQSGDATAEMKSSLTSISLKTCRLKRMTTKTSSLKRPERTSPTSAVLTNTTR
ncbi:hypothetical protein ACXO8C_05230 [Lactobacillus delbrueckii subsp. bulgaricus]